MLRVYNDDYMNSCQNSSQKCIDTTYCIVGVLASVIIKYIYLQYGPLDDTIYFTNLFGDQEREPCSIAY